MNKAYKFRIYPTKSQEVLLAKTFGCVRYFWNQCVATFNSYDKEKNPNPEYKTSTALRNELEWMKEVSAAAIQQKEIDFKEFKKQRFSKTRKKAINNPQFKSKSNRQSYRLPNQKFKLLEGKVQLEKIGKVRLIQDRGVVGRPLSITVAKNPSGQYFVTIICDSESTHLPKTNKSVGIDVGLKEFLTTSENKSISNPRYFRKSQAKLAKVQRSLSRKVKGSKRRGKCRKRVAKVYQKITNQRDWFLHNVSTQLIREFDTIVIEDLNVAGMVKNRNLAKSISDASFNKFFQMLSYKAEWYGKEVIKIGRFEPTSKKCSGCGWEKPDLTIKDRTFECECCGLTIDRDYNAAINIKQIGLRA